MDFLTDDVRQLYKKFLGTSMLSALMVSIYSFVDTIAVGQSEGPVGAAAMAIISPFYGITVFLGLLCGIGGSVLMSSAKAQGQEDEGNEYFTVSLLLIALVTAVTWVVFLLFPDPIFTFFGADGETLPKVKEYATLIIAFTPVFIVPISLQAFVRNDGAPGLSMASVAIGGGLNIFLDWFLVFPMGMGMRGAALATVIGNCVQTAVVCVHLFRKNCHLKLRRPAQAGAKLGRVCSVGVGAGVLDLGTVVTAVIMNNQLLRYGGTSVLAVYGALGTITALFQSMFGGVGQAIQPLVSSNFAVKQRQRINAIMRMAAGTIAVLSVVFFAVGELFPAAITRLFIDVTPEVLEVAPMVMRWYFPIFLCLGINVLATYYLQSVMRDKVSMAVAVARSVVVNGVLLFVLPLFLGLVGVLVAMPISELLVAVAALVYIKRAQTKIYL
ncbi:MAG: polysaccharide biosynthesis C-terminal domain-containing protein [Oscillospiraceae bacterium]|nr:polysaccharide biosynthesis C-terminal domain-containing protein [Oscillospiraceae bacterium]